MRLHSLLFLPLLSLPLLLALRAPDPAAPSVPAEAGWRIDPDHSTVLFKIKHLDTSWTYGRFNTLSGDVLFDEAKPELCKVNCQIEIASVDTNSKPRDEHLRGPDFFSAREFPSMTFATTRVGKEGAKYNLVGDLTLHGVKRSVTFSADKVGASKSVEAGERMGFHAVTSLKRSDFGMKLYPEAIGDVVEVTLSIELMR